MGKNLKSSCDEILQQVVAAKARVPGVVAMITDRSANIYEGAAGERILGVGQAMKTDTVFAIFSTTKAITGTAILQCGLKIKATVDAALLSWNVPITRAVPFESGTTWSSVSAGLGSSRKYLGHLVGCFKRTNPGELLGISEQNLKWTLPKPYSISRGGLPGSMQLVSSNFSKAKARFIKLATRLVRRHRPIRATQPPFLQEFFRGAA